MAVMAGQCDGLLIGGGLGVLITVILVLLLLDFLRLFEVFTETLYRVGCRYFAQLKQDNGYYGFLK
jgi:hypothetical protein